MDQHNKNSPHQAAYDQPIPMNTFSNVNSIPNHGNNHSYFPIQTMPVQEMEGAYPIPQELSTEQYAQGVHQSQNESPAVNQVHSRTS